MGKVISFSKAHIGEHLPLPALRCQIGVKLEELQQVEQVLQTSTLVHFSRDRK